MNAVLGEHEKTYF